MKYERFEQLPVWEAGIELAASVYGLTLKPAFRRRHSLRDQIERAAVSVSNNVAEGFERGTNQELLTFLYIARGSAGEVRSMLCLLERIPAFAELEPDLSGIEVQGREHFEAARCVDPVAAKFGTARRALCKREDAAGGQSGPRPARLLGRVGTDSQGRQVIETQDSIWSIRARNYHAGFGRFKIQDLRLEPRLSLKS
ncbi:MAG TPA: four helix bundle protein [Terriglobia bacterium]|nr:four helix bundle protein [Terriglobia bacterium]